LLAAFRRREAQRWVPGKVVLGDYEVLAGLGQGATGAVYLVQSCSTRSRFALKRVVPELIWNPDCRRPLLRELVTWCELPPHPNLVGFRFFRTQGEEIFIFSEYVPGGALRDWIRCGRIVTVAQALDIGIQLARGLQAAHELGIVHQDVKPGNVLLTEAGTAKLTDFGLARAAWAQAAWIADEGDEGSAPVAVRCSGMTPAYSSPEQAARRLLTPATDIWSWGGSLLEVFAGGLRWISGEDALVVFAELQRPGAVGGPLLPIPSAVAEVLERCFRLEPGERWSSMAELAAALEDVYEQVVRAAYPRPPPRPSPEPMPDRATRGCDGGGGPFAAQPWRAPEDWLALAFERAEIERTPAEVLIETSGRRPRARHIADLAAYEEARLILEDLVFAGMSALRPDLAELLLQKAMIHKCVDDLDGAAAQSDQAVEVWEEICLDDDGDANLAALGRACFQSCGMRSYLRDYRRARELSRRSIQVWETLVARRNSVEDRIRLAGAWMNEGGLCGRIREHQASRTASARAIAILEPLIAEGAAVGEQLEEARHFLAQSCNNLAAVLREQGDLPEALRLFDRAIEIWGGLVFVDGDQRFAQPLAMSLMNKAATLRSHGRLREAVALYDRAIASLESCPPGGDDFNLAVSLALALVNRAAALSALGEHAAAEADIVRAIGIWREQMAVGGHHELAGELAKAYMQRAIVLRDRGNPAAALEQIDEALEIWSRLLHFEGRVELRPNLFHGYCNKATICVAQGRHRDAARWFARALEVAAPLQTDDAPRAIRVDILRARAERVLALLSAGTPAAGEGAAVLSALRSALAEAPHPALEELLRRLEERLPRSAGGEGEPGGC